MSLYLIIGRDATGNRTAISLMQGERSTIAAVDTLLFMMAGQLPSQLDSVVLAFSLFFHCNPCADLRMKLSQIFVFE